jgi:hypothetical protein
VSTSENFPVPITLSGSDVETSAANLTFTVPGQPAHGTLSGTPPNLSYTPNFNYNGTDTIKYTVTDRGDPDNCGAPGPGCAAALTSAPATVTITVYPVNVAPVPTSTYVTKPEDAAFSITLTGSDTETARANLTFAVTVPPTHGTLSGTAPAFTYTPNPNYNGADSFSFAVMDRGDPDNCGALGIFCAAAKASAPAVVSISVTPVNDKPAADSKAVTTSENAPVSITLSGSDVETSPTNLTFTVTKVPSHGTLAGTAPYLTYTPNSNYVGIDTIKYSVMDRGDPDNCGTPGASCAAALTSGTATISITIR